ncbi:MAG: nucleoside-diphosphate kinase [bacterium]|jgi:nucleoside-diphosphate kinase|nr:nucleoside-diphosphate kinase [bacterium]
MERTLVIIKPDAVEQGHIGHILSIIEEQPGLDIIALRKVRLSPEDARTFYAIHKERPFYGELVQYMTRGPVVAIAVEGENAVKRMREVIGATNPKEAAAGTIRKLYAASIGENAVHGSDSPENGRVETSFFFFEREFLRLRR